MPLHVLAYRTRACGETPYGRRLGSPWTPPPLKSGKSCPSLYAAARLDCGTRIGPLRAAASRVACAALQASHLRFCGSDPTPKPYDYQALIHSLRRSKPP